MAPSDAREGLKQALREAFPGLIWQRYQSCFKRNVMDQTPASYKDRMDHQVLDRILKASSQQEAQDRFDDLRGELAEEAPSALEVLEGGLHEATRRRGPARQVPQATPHNEATRSSSRLGLRNKMTM